MFKFLSISLLLILAAGCSQKLPPDIQRSLNTTIAYADDYKHSHGSYPTHDQFHAWLKPNDLPGVVDYDVVISGTNEVYRVYLWLGERMRIYTSDSKLVTDSSTSPTTNSTP